MTGPDYRKLPAVQKLAEDPDLAPHVARYGREAVVKAAAAVIDRARVALKAGAPPPLYADLVAGVQHTLERRPALYQQVINATGVILHTNLGRAPLPAAAWDAMRAAGDACDLELDLATGKRASRLRGVAAPLVAVTGAEAGFTVNNNAAAVLLGLAALAGRKPTAISRGHLVEIGGGFRLPTIMEASGSPLLEIGTTNRTHLADYRQAIEAGAALILLVHRSNFVMSGYVTEPQPAEVIGLAHEHHVPVMLDLGSGALFDTVPFGLPRELTVTQAVLAGFDVVCFSGDKLVGGPQAGHIVGRRAAVERLRKHPLARAVRCDKLQLAAAVATLDLYARGEAVRQVPIWRMLETPTEALVARAESWAAAVGQGEVVTAFDAVGGGSLPEGQIAGCALALTTDDPDALLASLRRLRPPIIGHIDDDRVLLHPRTVLTEDDPRVVAGLVAALAAR
ncbi:MAG: L-seryl-tRNA(Sec) selenium transferase [Deltaproteobacteria bacterium]|nr:L-seryl-tRNA(Sec) selenium transferase [Deltaproteobacteria bacterium]